MSTDTTPDAAGHAGESMTPSMHASGIKHHARGMQRWVEHIWEHGGKPTANDLASLSGSVAEITDHVAALDAARIAAEARAERLRQDVITLANRINDELGYGDQTAEEIESDTMWGDLAFIAGDLDPARDRDADAGEGE